MRRGISIPTRQNYEINPAYMAQVKQVLTEYRADVCWINDHWEGGGLGKTTLGTTVNPTINAKMEFPTGRR